MRRSLGLPLALAIACMLLPVDAAAQTASVTGTVVDSVTGTPVEGVRVELVQRDAVVARLTTGPSGEFQFEDVAAGSYDVVFRRIDYNQLRLRTVTLQAGSVDLGRLLLSPLAYSINPVTVSASRIEQKVLDAPASVSVIDRQAVEERPALTAIDHLYGTSGVDIATTGLMQHEVVVRGFNNVSSTALLTLADNRYASVPALRINVYNFIPIGDDDIERIELVRGPGAALYGPNSAAGVLHIITRSPFDSRGTTLTLSGGERSLLAASVRHASAINDRVGIKLSGLYQRGNDWSYTDPREVANRATAIAGGADPDTLLIGARDPYVERVGGEARVDWRVSTASTLKVFGGLNHAFRNVDVTSVGATQIRDWRAWYTQAQFTTGRLFAQAFINQSSAGGTYLLRSGSPIIDNSRMLVGQVQHGVLLGNTNVTYGVDLQRTEPRTGGTITGRNEDDDIIDEAGGYVHTETHIRPEIQLIAAIRGDWHNRLDNPVFSPRAALVMQPHPNHTVRLTYNRAFATPSVNNLFLDLLADSISPPFGPALPFAVRVSGVPTTGYTFRRDCNGVCMRSPFTPNSLGGPGTYIPTDGTLLWDNIVDTLNARIGLDLSAIPAPTAADVSTNVLLVDISGNALPIDTVLDIPALRPAITNGIEVGYRTVLAERFVVGVDLYYERKNDFIGPLRVETPSAFLDSTDLADYLGIFIAPDTARLVANLVSQLPVGTVSPVEARDPWDLIITYRNFGDIDLWGADLELGMFVTPELLVSGTYSWVNNNVFSDPSGLVVPLNAPKHKGSFRITFRSERLGLFAEARGRAVQGFPVNSGVYAGDVGSYAVFDAQLGYRLPWARNVTVTVSGQNIFDHRHAEFIGTPNIGRLVMARVRTEF